MKKLALIVITVLIVFYSNKITSQTTTASGYTITGIVKGIDNVYINPISFAIAIRCTLLFALK